MKKEYEIKFPIGDWSNDGHGQCQWFRIKSNKPVQEVREAHFLCERILGFNIGSICSEYEESMIEENILKILKDNEIDISYLFVDATSDATNEEDPLYNNPEELIQLWKNILMFLDKDLQLEIIKDNTPMINFYGFDEKSRHIKVPGYGVFWQ